MYTMVVFFYKRSFVLSLFFPYLFSIDQSVTHFFFNWPMIIGSLFEFVRFHSSEIYLIFRVQQPIPIDETNSILQQKLQQYVERQGNPLHMVERWPIKLATVYIYFQEVFFFNHILVTMFNVSHFHSSTFVQTVPFSSHSSNRKKKKKS